MSGKKIITVIREGVVKATEAKFVQVDEIAVERLRKRISKLLCIAISAGRS